MLYEVITKATLLRDASTTLTTLQGDTSNSDHAEAVGQLSKQQQALLKQIADLGDPEKWTADRVITSYSIHYTKLYEPRLPVVVVRLHLRLALPAKPDRGADRGPAQARQTGRVSPDRLRLRPRSYNFV